MDLGRTIKQARRKRNMTISSLAAGSGLTKGFISQLEAGKSNPSMSSLARIARALGVPVSTLTEENAGSLTARSESERLAPQLFSARNAYHERKGLKRLTNSQAGSHFVVDLPAFTSLANETTFPDTTLPLGTLVCVAGSLLLKQALPDLKLSSGDLVTWNTSVPYSIENRSGNSATVILFIPDASPLPEFTSLRARASDSQQLFQTSNPALAFASLYEGPMRLVGMRARRLAEKGR